MTLKDTIDLLILTKDLDKNEDPKSLHPDLLTPERREEVLKNWCASAEKVRTATHTIKQINTKASGTDINWELDSTRNRPGVVGTHRMGRVTPDIISLGGASCTNVFSLLQLEYEGKSILELARAKDAELLGALSDDPNIAEQRCETLSCLALDESLSTHELAKQVYYPVVGENAYHLLLPLFPAALSHEIFNTINKDKKRKYEVWEALKKKTDDEQVDLTYRTHPNIGVRKVGGSKPQNVGSAFLNNQRGSQMLLASLPPTWGQRPVHLSIESVFHTIDERNPHIKPLSGLISSAYSNKNIRDGIERRVNQLFDEVLLLVEELQMLDSGWSEHSKLRQEERLWLDPENGSDINLSQIQELAEYGVHHLTSVLSRTTQIESVYVGKWAKTLEDKLRFEL